MDSVFRKANRESDITIGDFWGIDRSAPDMNDNKGISAIIIHSPKGEKLFEDISSELVFKKSDFGSVERHNAVINQLAVHKNRERFYKNLDNVDLEQNIKKNIQRHSVLLVTSCKIAKACLKALLSDESFEKLKNTYKKVGTCFHRRTHKNK